MKSLLKYLRYFLECVKTKDLRLTYAAVKLLLFKKLPQKDMLIANPVMGTFFCRANTTDFMYSFFSYEYKIKEKILKHINEFNVFIDIGACIGDYSIWMAKNKCKSYAFEPVNENYQLLNKNINLNQLGNKIQTFNYALGSKDESAKFVIHPHNKGASSKYSKITNASEQEVIIRKIDDVFKELNFKYEQNFIVKIDAEGMELEIIKGAENFISNANKIFLIIEAIITNREDILCVLKKIATVQVFDIDSSNVGIFIKNTNKK